ncbi:MULTISPECIES: 2-dehydropantoate 2-reductase [unclassified Vibrio]|uniref:2-dehydropantoate 2-reductase n=1 Tax=Vibrio sp. HB236076 TaxID=3232307 RepID=A0AB39HEG5_9VIBR|nr:2-dehydropantoate 2-reductase [Vibrio sp. HB161653]MDP5254897.1 2-dehydropantoate 2-reductase [Vibrio sp. HB161653]
MNIVILGPGAIGSLWACHLQRSGHRVSLLGRHLGEPYQRTFNGQTYHFPSAQTPELQQADVVLVTVKAWQVEQALQAWQNVLAPQTIIVLLHNGMGTAERVAKHFAQQPILLATTTHGAYRPHSDTLEHTGLGDTFIGAYNHKGQQCTFIADVFDHALSPVSWAEDIETKLWQKVIVNSAINPLTALYQCRNGDLLTQPDWAAQVEKLVFESCEVANQSGQSLQSDEMLRLVHQVIRNTASNYSSMQQDVFYQRPTEIDYITGFILSKAKRHPMPVHLSVYQQLTQRPFVPESL